MRQVRLAVLPVALAFAAPAVAQSTASGQAGETKFRFAGDALARYEWTRDIPGETGDQINQSRWRLQARPRVELGVGPLELGVGGEFNYSQDRNDRPPEGQQTLALVRDNYRSRDARLDLAYGRLKLGRLRVEGGRFLMSIPLTEMIWDRDLRPQGGAASLELGQAGSSRLSLTGIYAKGSHVFEDESRMFGGAAQLQLVTGVSSQLQLVGSYLEFRDLQKLELAIRRQNTRNAAGLLADQYRVADVVARLSGSGQVPVLLVADYCWNTAIDQGNRGLWLAASLGSLETSRAQAAYTYARIDRDATVAAFNTDDFYWGTGWEGHRADLGTGAGRNSSIHAIAQWQRYKDSPDPLVAEHWVKRWRVELRTSF